jgi:spore coat polysaccharide biosynthesis predicted glycosyltransferase SpsG
MRGVGASVIFAATAGPRRGFGHLVRCGVLADALGVDRVVVLRSSSAATTRVARRLGWQVCTWRQAVNTSTPGLLIIDDPSAAHTRTWVRRARRLRIPVATIQDGGALHAASDLAIDGSAVSPHCDRPRRLAGPAFAVLRGGSRRRVIGTRVGSRPHIVIALGGGIHVRRLGARVAAEIVRRRPQARVDLAAGFIAGNRPSLPRGCRWVGSDQLAAALSSSSVCVVSGGVTLYEACAFGTPAVAVAVVPAQRPAVNAVVRAKAALTVHLDRPNGLARLAGVVCLLLEQPVLQRVLSRHARRLVDGRGTARVAARLTQLLKRRGSAPLGTLGASRARRGTRAKPPGRVYAA